MQFNLLFCGRKIRKLSANEMWDICIFVVVEFSDGFARGNWHSQVSFLSQKDGL
jgi:hypothetical protein